MSTNSPKDTLTKLIQKTDLSGEEAKDMILQALEGKLSDALIAGWLTASAAKSETSEEIFSYAEVMREKAKRVFLDLDEMDAMDTCGTGGDGSNLMNISTLTGITLASLKIPVAKHGNRSVSSKSGSADILEALGYTLDQTPEQVSKSVKKHSFGFMFAPNFHPAMKHVAPIRKELGIRTVFNILGPLCNPARVNVQLMGVFSQELLDIMSRALQKMQTKCACVFTSEDGLDEISPLAKTKYRIVYQDKISSGDLTPPSNMSIKSLDEIRVKSPEDALQKAKAALEGSFSAGAETLALNTVVGLFIWEVSQRKAQADELQNFVDHHWEKVKTHILEGKALPVIENMQI